MPPPYSAESPRLWLQPLSLEEHLDDFHELWTDEEAVKWTTRIPKTSIQETAEWMPSLLPSEEMPDIDKWAILLRPNGNEEEGKKPKCIGILGTNRWSDQGMETGYCLNKAYWGKGYATEAFKMFLDMYWKLPERKEIKGLVAKVYPDNLQSVRVLMKCNGREGEVLKSVELRGGAGERGDLYCWYFDRPVSEPEVAEKASHEDEKASEG